MKNIDDFGFPEPATFENEHRTKKNSTAHGWRFMLFGIFFAGLIAAMIHFSGKIPPGMLDNLMGNNPQAIARRFEEKRLRGDLEGALNESEKMVKVMPNVGHLFRAMVLTDLGRTRESIDEYTRAIELGCPMEATAYNNRAYNRALERIDLKKALADIHKAIAIRGDEPAFIDTRGYIYYLLGESELALDDFNSILENGQLDRSSLGEIYFHRGLVYRFLGKVEKASQDFLDAQELGFNIEDYPEPVQQPSVAEPKADQNPVKL